MALINCPECNKEISDRAKACPNCGFPMDEVDEVICPEFPSDLSLGKLKSVSNSTLLGCDFDSNENNNNEFTNGRVFIQMYQNGIELKAWNKKFLPLHKSQIVLIKQMTHEEVTENKSVIGRALIGSVFGGVGAVVGGLSGIGKKKVKGKRYLIIKYWDITSKKLKALILNNQKDMSKFVNRFNNEIKNTY